MALCPICEQPLPDEPQDRCPHCGAVLAGPSVPPPLPSAAPPAADRGASAGAAPGPEPGGEGTPWDDRARLGYVSALVETTRQVLTGPAAFFRRMPVRGIESPLLYGAILGWIGTVAAAFYSALFHSIVGASLADALRRLAGPHELPPATALTGMLEGWGSFAVQVVFGAVIAAVVILIGAGILHLALMLLGGARRGFEATLGVVSYSQAACVVFLLPFCGQPIGAIWALVLYVIGLAEAHRIGYGKAIAAVLLPLLVLCCCCAGIVGLVSLGIAGLAAQMQ